MSCFFLVLMTFYGNVKHTPANCFYCIQHPHAQFKKYLLHQRCISVRKQNGVMWNWFAVLTELDDDIKYINNYKHRRYNRQDLLQCILDHCWSMWNAVISNLLLHQTVYRCFSLVIAEITTLEMWPKGVVCIQDNKAQINKGRAVSEHFG